MPRDLTADRGSAVNMDTNAAEMPRGGDPYGLIEALENDTDQDDEKDDQGEEGKQPAPDDDDEDEDLDEEDDDLDDDEDEDLEGKKKNKKDDDADEDDGSIELEGYGRFSADELEEAVQAQNRLLEIEEDYETLNSQRAEMETLAEDLRPIMAFQDLLSNPTVGNAVRTALLNVMRTNPEVAAAVQAGTVGVFGGRRQQESQLSPAVEQRLRRLEEREYAAEKDRHGRDIDGLFDSYRDQFGKAWPKDLKEQIIRSAVRTYGKNLNPQALKDHADAVIYRMKLRPEKSQSDPKRIQEALDKKGKGVRILKPTGGSRRAVTGRRGRMPDTTKMSDKDFDRWFSKQVG